MYQVEGSTLTNRKGLHNANNPSEERSYTQFRDAFTYREANRAMPLID